MSQSTPEAASNVLGLGEIFRLLIRRIPEILVTLFLTVAITAYYTYKQPRIYDAVSRIDIDLTSPKTSIPIGALAGSEGGSDIKMATQLGIITSEGMAWTVIRNLRLYQNPAFGGSENASINVDKISDAGKLGFIRAVRAGLLVQYDKGTEIAAIHFRSTDPKLAAQMANAVVDAYMQRNFQVKYKLATDTTSWLNDQLGTLRDQVQSAEREFAAFQEKTGILQTPEGHNASIDKLTQLENALSAAQTQRILKEIDYRQSQTADPELITPVSQIPTLQQLRGQKANLQGEYASLSTKYGENYPRIIQLRNQLASIQREIDIFVKQAREQTRMELEAAKANESQLRSALETQKQAIFATNQDALQYSLLQQQLSSKRQLYEDLVKQLQEAQITSGLSGDAISIVDRALVPNIPAAPRRLYNLEVGALLGVILGIAVAFLLENINSAIRSTEDIRLHSDLPILSLIPHFMASEEKGAAQEGGGIQSAIIAVNSRSHFSEAFRNLRSSLLLSAAGSPPQVIAVCSAFPKEGKSTTAINLAIVLAQTGKKVLLVDADLRRPSLHFRLGVSKMIGGLSTLLSGAQNQAQFITENLGIPGLSFLAAGPTPPSSAELLMSDTMRQLLQDWRQIYDFIVLDTAPMLAVSDTGALVSMVDSSVLVLRAGQTRKQALRTLKTNIERFGGRITGVVLNDLKSSSQAYYDYYGGKGNYGSYYYGDPSS